MPPAPLPVDAPRLNPHHGTAGAGRLLLAVVRQGIADDAVPAAAALVAALDADAAGRRPASG
jgi:hypothetical protein